MLLCFPESLSTFWLLCSYLLGLKSPNLLLSSCPPSLFPTAPTFFASPPTPIIHLGSQPLPFPAAAVHRASPVHLLPSHHLAPLASTSTFISIEYTGVGLWSMAVCHRRTWGGFSWGNAVWWRRLHPGSSLQSDNDRASGSSRGQGCPRERCSLFVTQLDLRHGLSADSITE